ncbi:hypothetical protein R1sor_016190 [Riccia sorocarpa]|uniref:Cytochrome P450 n=1 Tax=Riccia sorocarpa TaxID=122646 RepID=A0ABD3HG53_9MARC
MNPAEDLENSTARPSSQLILAICISGVTGLLLMMMVKIFGRKDDSTNSPPGPSRLPVIGHLHLLSRLAHQSLVDLSLKHGPIMMLQLGSIRTLVISSPDMAMEILKSQDHIFASRPASVIGDIFLHCSNDLLMAPLGDHWRFMRRTCVTELFSPKRVAEFSERRRVETLRTVKRMLEEGQEGNDEVEIDHNMKAHAFNILTQVLFRKSYHGQKAGADGEAQEFHVLMQEFTSIGFFVVGEFLPWLRRLRIDVGGIEAKLRNLSTKFDSFLRKLIEDHRHKMFIRQNNEIEDFVDVLLSLQNEAGDGKSMTDDQIIALLQNLLIAGSDSEANTLVWIMTELMRNPEIREKLQRDVDAVVGQERLVEEADLVNLPYLQCVVKESLRLHPTAPLLVPHASVSATKVAGYDIPEKTQVFVNVYAIQRDSRVWENALVFNPERFMDSQEGSFQGQNFKFLPFGSGRRICVGMNLALVTVEYTLALLLQTCTFSLPQGMHPQDVSVEESYGSTLSRAHPLKVLVRPRISSKLIDKDL